MADFEQRPSANSVKKSFVVKKVEFTSGTELDYHMGASPDEYYILKTIIDFDAKWWAHVTNTWTGGAIYAEWEPETVSDSVGYGERMPAYFHFLIGQKLARLISDNRIWFLRKVFRGAAVTGCDVEHQNLSQSLISPIDPVFESEARDMIQQTGIENLSKICSIDDFITRALKLRSRSI